MNNSHIAATVIARARQNHTQTSPEEGGGSADDFDYYISSHGIEPYGPLYQETYALANEFHPIVPGEGTDQLDKCRDRAAKLWEKILPELKIYEADCRQAKFTGWSRESNSPVRRVR